MGGLSIVLTFLGLRLASEVGSVSVFALNLVTGLGLGLAIDYSLFIVSRYREELEKVGPGAEAMRRTLATAGRTVLFSSLTVTAALASLLVFPQRFLYSMGLGGMMVSIIAAAVALTVLPAVLVLLGPRVNSLAPKRLQRARESEARGTADRASGTGSRAAVMRRPGRTAIASAAVLIALGAAVPGHQVHVGRRQRAARDGFRAAGGRRASTATSRPRRPLPSPWWRRPRPAARAGALRRRGCASCRAWRR